MTAHTEAMAMRARAAGTRKRPAGAEPTGQPTAQTVSASSAPKLPVPGSGGNERLHLLYRQRYQVAYSLGMEKLLRARDTARGLDPNPGLADRIAKLEHEADAVDEMFGEAVGVA